MSTDNPTYLGKLPICDICEGPITENQVVKQIATGKVKFDEVYNELYLAEDFEVFHVECSPNNNIGEWKEPNKEQEESRFNRK